MITLIVGPEALARVRFAISPLMETMLSVRVLAEPAAQALHMPWVVQARRSTEDLDLELLRALQPTQAYTPDFVHPPPSSPLAEFEEELARMTATAPSQARAEVQRSYAGRPLPDVLTPFIAAPAAALQGLAELLSEYWQRALLSHWPRIKPLLEGDILYRARQIADGGAQQLFEDLDPAVRWVDGVLTVDKRARDTLDLDERGLLLVPSVFVWPAVTAIMDPVWQPELIYPARGVGMLWEPQDVPTVKVLGDLLGARRSSILLSLDQPRSTTELARRLRINDSSVSQHLGVLSRAGLVSAHRAGRVVLYLRSAAGDALVRASPESSSPASAM